MRGPHGHEKMGNGAYHLLGIACDAINKLFFFVIDSVSVNPTAEKLAKNGAILSMKITAKGVAILV